MLHLQYWRWGFIHSCCEGTTPRCRQAPGRELNVSTWRPANRGYDEAEE